MLKSILHALTLASAMLLPVPVLAKTVAVYATNESGLPVVELASVQISQQSGIDLLDRSRVEQVLAEQKLAAFGDDSDPLLLGRMLKVETFTVWEQQHNELKGRLVVYDGPTGLRMIDCTLEGATLDALADQISSRIQESGLKQKLIRDTRIHPVSITSVRNVNLPPEWEPKLALYLASLEQAITQNPDCALVERARLRYVIREQSLPLAEQQGHLLAAATTLTVEVSRIGTDTLQVSLHAGHAADSKRTSQSTQINFAQPVELVKASEALIAQMAKALEREESVLTPDAKRSDEAAILISEGHRLLTTREPEKAAIAFEAAWALGDRSSSLSFVNHSLAAAIEGHLSVHRINIPAGYPGVPRVAPLTAEDWGQIIQWGEYQADLIELDRIEDMRRSEWPRFHLKRPRSPEWSSSVLATTSLFSLPSNVLSQLSNTDHRSRIQACLRKSWQSRERSKQEGRSRLEGEERQRFEKYLAEADALIWTGPAVQTFLPDWEMNFVSAVLDNLRSGDGLSRLNHFIATTGELTEEPRSALVSGIAAARSDYTAENRLAADFFVMQARLHGKRELSTESPEWRDLKTLVDEFIEYYEHADATGQVASSSQVAGVRFEIGGKRGAASPHLRLICGLHPNPHDARRLHADAGLELMRRGIVEPSSLVAILPRGTSDDAELLNKALALLRSKRMDLTEAEQSSLIEELERKLKEYGGPGLPQGPLRADLPFPWKTVREVSIEGKPIRGNIQWPVLLDEDNIYVAFVYEDRSKNISSLTLARCPLSGEQAWANVVGVLETPLAEIARVNQQVQVSGTQGFGRFSYYSNFATPNRLVASDKHVYVPTSGTGMVAFPKAGGVPTLINTESGLPSNCVQAMTLVGDVLYAWVGERGQAANLVSLNLITREVKLLASCQREQARTPLDNMPHAFCKYMLSNPTGNKLLMAVMEGRKRFGLEPRNGLWEYDVESHVFTQIPAHSDGQTVSPCGPFQLSVRQFDVQKNTIAWTLVNASANNRCTELPVEEISPDVQPVWCGPQFTWWKVRSSATLLQQDNATGNVSEWRSIPKGRTLAQYIQFDKSEQAAIIQADMQIWIGTELDLDGAGR
ncbi:MAG: hypothetical protein R3C18_26555 [Planctomycetaceae bacterium]